jgi:hypothetical protein
MAEDIQHDKLGDFVRKSFEGYEEDPAPDMWERVKGDLVPLAEPGAPPLQAAFLRKYRWQAAAATIILLLLSTLVCEHFYYEKQLRALTASQRAVPDSPEVSRRAPSNLDAPTAIPPAAEKRLEAGISAQAPPIKRANEPTVNRVLPKSAVAAAPSPIEPPTSFAHADSPHETRPNLPAQASVPTSSPTGDSAQIAQSSDLRMSDFAPIAPRLGAPIEISTRPHTPNQVEITPSRAASGWYLGLQTMLLASNDKKERPAASRPGPPIFSNKQDGVEISRALKINVGKKISARLALESGIAYQKIIHTATHSPQFRFGDGQSTSASTQRAFDYYLNTYSGTAAVTLRAETSTPSTPSENEQLPFRIKTRERVEMLRVPLLVSYRVGSGRLRGNVKTGLVGNFFLKNEVDIAARASQNPRFRLLAGRDGYTIELDQKEKFSLGYWVSAGAELRLNKRLSVVAEPSFMGDFARKSSTGNRLPEWFGLGLSVGVQCYL